MGNSLSSWGGQSRVQKIINKAGLPLEIDASQDDDEKTPLSTFTEAYPAPGWFTGVRSAITIEKSVEEVYNSLAKDLHHVFTPMSECDDDVQQNDGEGKQEIFRIVRIPFKVAFVTGNLKLRLNVKQDKKAGKIHFESAKEGRLITKFVADFDIHSSPDRPEETIVKLDSKVSCKSLPPPPFKNMVKDVMVKKMDSCMVDLLNFHTQDVSDDDFASACDESVHGDELGKIDASQPSQRSAYGGFMGMMRSLSAPLRHSLELLERRYSVEKPRQPGLQDTAHDALGHHPTAEISVKPAVPDVNEPQAPALASSVYSDSSLYKSSTDGQKLVSQQSSQADVFSTWQERTAVPSSPFMAASK